MTLLASKISPDGIAASMELRQDIYRVIASDRPMNIIETGTYKGLGSTSAVLHGLKDAGITGWSFVTIESNMHFYREAVKNLEEEKYNGTLVLMNANSIPNEMMPKVIYDVPDDVITDHIDPMEYLKEVPDDVQDDGLSRAMQLLNYRPDLVILDSAGHLGFIEFEYVCRLAEKAFVLILDDTKHRKHYDTMQYIIANPDEFTILKESNKKFGHAIIYVK